MAMPMPAPMSGALPGVAPANEPGCRDPYDFWLKLMRYAGRCRSAGVRGAERGRSERGWPKLRWLGGQAESRRRCSRTKARTPGAGPRWQSRSRSKRAWLK
jgi:hypothetical protein